MARKTFYRDWVPVVAEYNAGDDGFSEIEYVKGNLQPWKSGNGTVTDNGSFLFEDYFILYTKRPIQLTKPASVPENPRIDKYFFLKGNWYLIQGAEDWTYAGRNPKHNKVYGGVVSGQTDITPDVGIPTPFASLVDDFETVVNELYQVSLYYNE